MIGQWFLDKVKELTDAHHRLVITDTQGDGAFLLDYLPARRYIVLTASKPSEERRVRTEAERDYREKNVIFYTTIPQKNCRHCKNMLPLAAVLFSTTWKHISRELCTRNWLFTHKWTVARYYWLPR